MLSGCLGAEPSVVVRTETRIERVPGALITPCVRTPYAVETTADLINGLNALAADFDKCAAKVTATAKWDANLAVIAPTD